MPLNIKQTEKTAYNKIHATPFTRINGRSTRSNYELLKRKCSKQASEIEDAGFPWCTDNTTGKEYGLLANIMGQDEYKDLTAIDIGNVPEQQPLVIQPEHQGRHRHTSTKTHGRKIGPQAHSMVHQKGFLERHSSQSLQCPQQAIISATTKRTHCIS
jgi:hypothetical protein